MMTFDGIEVKFVGIYQVECLNVDHERCFATGITVVGPKPKGLYMEVKGTGYPELDGQMGYVNQPHSAADSYTIVMAELMPWLGERRKVDGAYQEDVRRVSI